MCLRVPWADAARAAENAQNNTVNCGELQKVIENMEKERSRLLEITGRKQKLRIGAVEESQETIFQSMLGRGSGDRMGAAWSMETIEPSCAGLERDGSPRAKRAQGQRATLYTVPPRSKQIRHTPETFFQAEVSIVNGINQATSLHQQRAAPQHTTTITPKTLTTTQHGTTRRNDATTHHTVPTTQNHKQQQQPTNHTNNSFRNRNSNNGHVRRGSLPSLLSFRLDTALKVTGHPSPLDNEWRATSLRTETSSCTCTIFSCPLGSVPARVFRPTRRHMYRIISIFVAVTNSELLPTEDYICICFCTKNS